MTCVPAGLIGCDVPNYILTQKQGGRETAEGEEPVTSQNNIARRSLKDFIGMEVSIYYRCLLQVHLIFYNCTGE